MILRRPFRPHMRKLQMIPSTAQLLATCVAVALCTSVVGSQDKVSNPVHRPKLHPTNPPRPVPGAGPQFGDPLPGLSAEQLADFEAGREEFESIETAAGGLGPIFN